MNVKLLIDAVISQTMVLIAQLSTTAGIRAPLAHVANQVFIDLVSNLEAQGLRRKVVADMFGLALRSYQLKVQRLAESATARDHSLWEAVLSFLSERGTCSRAEVHTRFHYDDPASVASVLRDLVDSGLLFQSGKGNAAIYRVASEDELRMVVEGGEHASTKSVIWIAVYRVGPISAEALAEHLKLELATVEGMLDELATEGRVEGVDDDEGVCSYSSETCVLPIAEANGWEAAVFDHFQSMVVALCHKLAGGDTIALPKDVIGGSTYSFDVWDGHPLQDEVLALLRTTRASVSALRARVTEFNSAHEKPTEGARKVVYYFGQDVIQDALPPSEEEL